MLRAPTSIRGRLFELGVCTALATGAVSAAASSTRADDLQVAERAVAEVSQLLADAHFRPARSVAEATLEQTGRADASPQLQARRARLHVLLATAQVALHDEEAAHESLRRALALEPTLALDTATTSPKVVRALREARGDDPGTTE